APGGYNYARNVAPVVPTLTADLVTAAKQEALRGAVRDAIYDAQTKYDTAKSELQARERRFRQRQAEMARERQRKADAQAAAAAQAQAALTRGNVVGVNVGGVDVVGSGGVPTMSPKNGRDGSAGYNFTDAAGRPVSALTFARLTGVSFPQLLTRMAQS